MSTPLERIDALERVVLDLLRQNAQLAEALMNQGSMLNSILQSLAESAHSLPGENPIRPQRPRHAKAN
jgi:hypothetical protein